MGGIFGEEVRVGVVRGIIWIGGQGGSGTWDHWDRGSGWEWYVGSLG